MPSPVHLGDPDVERLARRLRIAAAVVTVALVALVLLPHLSTSS